MICRMVRRRHAGGELAVYRLGDNKAEIVGQAVVQPPTPVFRRVGLSESGLHPDLGATQVGGTGRHIVRPQIEGAAACKIEARVVPVAGQNAVLDASAVERKSHVRTAIVKSEDASPVVNDEDRTMRPAHDEPSLGLKLLEATRADEGRDRSIHGRFA
jgi:hypothetical protein